MQAEHIATEPLPCPFCGGEAAISDMEPGYIVGCERCDAVMDVHYTSKAEATEAWNRRAAPVAPTMDAPQPDWSQAPEWAMWWAVDANGYPMWYMDKPYIEEGESLWMWQDNDGLASGIPSRHLPQPIKLPIGIDWRTTLTERPQAQEAT